MPWYDFNKGEGMKDLVYPAILYKDDEKGSNTGWFTVSIPDLGIVTEGENVVDAFIKAKEYLCATIECAVKFDCELESPSDFETIYKANKKNIVLLIDALT